MGVKEDVAAAVEPTLHDMGYQLVEAEYVKEGPRWFVRLYIFRPEGVGLEDCMAVSDAVEPLIESKDLIKTPYNLEVSSPGAERVLKTEREYRIFQGRLVRVTLREPVGNEHILHGHLGPITEHTIQIFDSAGQPRSLPRENVKQVRLALQSSATAGK